MPGQQGIILNSIFPIPNKKVLYFNFLAHFFQVFGTMVSTDKLEKSKNFTIIDITFDQKVVVTRSLYPTVNYATLLPKVGGALGLWLGLGVIQLFSSAVDLFSVCSNTIFEYLKRQ